MFPMRRVIQNIFRSEPLRLNIGSELAVPRINVKNLGFDPLDKDLDLKAMRELAQTRHSRFMESGISELSARDHSRRPEQTRVTPVMTTSIGNGQDPSPQPVEQSFTASRSPLDRFRGLARR
jgi:hypothetical protein